LNNPSIQFRKYVRSGILFYFIFFYDHFQYIAVIPIGAAKRGDHQGESPAHVRVDGGMVFVAAKLEQHFVQLAYWMLNSFSSIAI
jgi:hypothetical protein